LETVRDLGRAEPWQESIDRSRARRGQPAKRQPAKRQPARRHSAKRQPAKRRRRAGGLRVSVLAVGGVAALAIAVPNVLADHAAPPSATADEAALQGYVSSPQEATGRPAVLPSHHVARPAQPCVPARASGAYANPLARARVKAERIDQGVDYAGTGTLIAIGEAKVTKVATVNTGWPGSFVEYRLLHGPDAGCFVYYAEGVEPAAKLRAGDTVHAGQPVATIISGWETGMEIGWGAGTNTKTLAMQNGKWSAKDDDDNKPSNAGRSFSALIVALGGPAGKVEGR
jgi:hypothetical protein